MALIDAKSKSSYLLKLDLCLGYPKWNEWVNWHGECTKANCGQRIDRYHRCDRCAWTQTCKNQTMSTLAIERDRESKICLGKILFYKHFKFSSISEMYHTLKTISTLAIGG